MTSAPITDGLDAIVPRKMFLDLLGRRVCIESDDERFMSGLQSCFDANRDVPKGETSKVDLLVRVHGEPPYRVETQPARAMLACAPWQISAPIDLCSALNQWAVSDTPRHYVFHAGAVARNGRGVLLAGNSHSGKSTLTAGLLYRGFELLSDEIGALDLRTRELSAYPRLLSIREDVFDVLQLNGMPDGCEGPDGIRFVHPAEFGSQFAKQPVPLSTIILPQYRAGEETRIEPVSTGTALVALFETSCTQGQLKTKGLDWILELIGEVSCQRLYFSDMPQALDLIEALADPQA